jgi:hypothetical protein
MVAPLLPHDPAPVTPIEANVRPAKTHKGGLQQSLRRPSQMVSIIAIA